MFDLLWLLASVFVITVLIIIPASGWQPLITEFSSKGAHMVSVSFTLT